MRYTLLKNIQMRQYVIEVIDKFTRQIGIIEPGKPEEYMGLIDQLNTIVVGEPNKGAILGVVAPHPFNPANVLIATELFWWVEPKYRASKFSLNLVKQFEEAAKAKGANLVMMMAIEHSNDMAIRLYPKLGYSKLETTFLKEI